MSENDVAVVKDEDNELSIPTVWHPIFIDIIKSFVEKDYLLKEGVTAVSAVSQDTADQIKDYIDDYGEVLTELPDESWESSIYIWMGSHWEVLIDLWTEGEGRSDLVLTARVKEEDNEYVVDIDMVYVP